MLKSDVLNACNCGQNIKYTALVAMDSNCAIGYKNKLLFHDAEELAHFKSTTMGGELLMGRKTYESLPNNLPGRRVFVLGKGYIPTLQDALAMTTTDNLFICGGSQIYDLTAPIWTNAIVTVFNAAAPVADAYFKHSFDGWRQTEIKIHKTFKIFYYER